MPEWKFMSFLYPFFFLFSILRFFMFFPSFSRFASWTLTFFFVVWIRIWPLETHFSTWIYVFVCFVSSRQTSTLKLWTYNVECKVKICLWFCTCLFVFQTRKKKDLVPLSQFVDLSQVYRNSTLTLFSILGTVCLHNCISFSNQFLIQIKGLAKNVIWTNKCYPIKKS